jgi:hypothetical protein
MTDTDELTAADVCTLLRVGPKKLRQLIEFANLPCYAYGGLRQGRRRRFSRSAVLAWRDEQRGVSGEKGKGAGGKAPKAAKARAAVSGETAGKRWNF